MPRASWAITPTLIRISRCRSAEAGQPDYGCILRLDGTRTRSGPASDQAAPAVTLQLLTPCGHRRHYPASPGLDPQGVSPSLGPMAVPLAEPAIA